MKTSKILLIIACLTFSITFLTGCKDTSDVNAQTAIDESSQNAPTVATFSIVAYDPNTGELGIAVQSKVVSVGSIVPWVSADAGAIATQAAANTTYGPEGLKLLKQGLNAEQVIKKLIDADEGSANRQIGIVDANGMPATFTGSDCLDWAGGKTGKHYAVQGNILAGPEVVEEMAKAFERSKGELGTRLIDALEAGQAAGGDKRGRQSAALYIVHEKWGYAGHNDRYRDIRVDDHPEPIKELRRVYEIHKQVFRQPRTNPRSTNREN